MERWPQSTSGLCRRCEREVAEERAVHAPLPGELSPAPVGQPGPRRTVVINGEEYEVVWP